MSPSDTIEVIQGTDDTLEFEFTEDVIDGQGQVVSTAALPITGYTLTLVVKQRKADSENLAVIKKVQATHTDPLNGKTSIALTQSDLAKTGKFLYELRLLSPGGVLTKSSAGTFIIEEDV